MSIVIVGEVGVNKLGLGPDPTPSGSTMAEQIAQKLELLGLATGVQFPNTFSDPSVQMRTHVDRWKTTNPQTRLWIHRLGYTLLNEHEKLFGSHWRHPLVILCII